MIEATIPVVYSTYATEISGALKVEILLYSPDRSVHLYDKFGSVHNPAH
jgi:hypothetical protein